MNKHDALFIRACKSRNAHERLRKVYHRFYLMDLDDYSVEPLINILARICGDYDLITLEKFVSEISPHNEWMYMTEPKKYDLRYLVLLSTVRIAPVDKFGPDYPKPLRFRRMDNE